MTVYHPFGQEIFGGRLFVHTQADPYALVPSVTPHHPRTLAADQPVERAATLEDVRAEVLAPNRLNAVVFGGFALRRADDRGGRRRRRAGVFGQRADARVRRPAGDRIARRGTCWTRIVLEGAVIAVGGIAAGVVGGTCSRASSAPTSSRCEMPGALPSVGAAAILIAAAVLASLTPAARAARVDVTSALRSE